MDNGIREASVVETRLTGIARIVNLSGRLGISALREHDMRRFWLSMHMTLSCLFSDGLFHVMEESLDQIQFAVWLILYSVFIFTVVHLCYFIFCT